MVRRICLHCRLPRQCLTSKQQGDNRTIGRKHTVPYGVYVAYGFVSAFLARQTGFSEEDLELIWQSLEQTIEHDRSAERHIDETGMPAGVTLIRRV